MDYSGHIHDAMMAVLWANVTCIGPALGRIEYSRHIQDAMMSGLDGCIMAQCHSIEP